MADQPVPYIWRGKDRYRAIVKDFKGVNDRHIIERPTTAQDRHH